MCLTPMTHALQIHQLLFPVLYTGYKGLKSEKTKDKSHNERCMLTICVYGYLCTKEGGWAVSTRVPMHIYSDLMPLNHFTV